MSVTLADVVSASTTIAATRSRLAKRDALAGVLEAAAGDEIPLVVAYLSGQPRQDKLGVGWSALSDAGPAPAIESVLSLTEIDDILEQLATTSGPGSVGRRAALLEQLLSQATTAEQDFLRRLLLRDLRQGATEGLMIEGIAAASGLPPADIRRAAMLSGSLVETGVLALTEGGETIAAVSLRVLTPIQPMLATTAEDLASAVAAFVHPSIEAKLDGARVQAHKLGDEVLLVTRNLNDVTQRMPEVVAAVESLPFTSVILDGEVLALGGDGRPHPFQETMSRFGTELDGAPQTTLALQPFFFDVLHADGEDTIDLPLVARYEFLDRLPEALRIAHTITSDAAAAQRFLAETLEAGHEGVVVKDLSAPYAAGRRGSSWLKVKPVHSLDLVVLAVEWGSGRRKGWLSNLHLGARDPQGGYVMLGKTFKGLTDSVLRWQTERFLELETHREGHVVHVRPEQVVEIALDGVQASTRYPGGVALRFARVRRYRDDKPASEVDTIDAVRALHRRSP